MSNNKSNGGNVRQRFGDLEKSPLLLSEDYIKQITEHLNGDLASHFMMYFQFKKQHWIVDGPDWKHISAALDEYAKTILENAEDLAEKINSLGAIPLSNPASFPGRSYVDFEGEDKYDIRTMLENDLKLQQSTIQQLRKRIEFAKENNDHGTDDILKDVLEDNEKIAHELHHYLQEESLERSLKG
ncbi:MAG: DNA starvation/stationary phase protection protein [Thermoproteota archaeon]|nr:DNA starvation/stationary phase protection protein [Thermoproteota archaeon]